MDKGKDELITDLKSAVGNKLTEIARHAEAMAKINKKITDLLEDLGRLGGAIEIAPGATLKSSGQKCMFPIPRELEEFLIKLDLPLDILKHVLYQAVITGKDLIKCLKQSGWSQVKGSNILIKENKGISQDLLARWLKDKNFTNIGFPKKGTCILAKSVHDKLFYIINAYTGEVLTPGFLKGEIDFTGNIRLKNGLDNWITYNNQGEQIP